jgi:hypothetical protein
MDEVEFEGIDVLFAQKMSRKIMDPWVSKEPQYSTYFVDGDPFDFDKGKEGVKRRLDKAIEVGKPVLEWETLCRC